MSRLHNELWDQRGRRAAALGPPTAHNRSQLAGMAPSLPKTLSCAWPSEQERNPGQMLCTVPTSFPSFSFKLVYAPPHTGCAGCGELVTGHTSAAPCCLSRAGKGCMLSCQVNTLPKPFKPMRSAVNLNGGDVGDRSPTGGSVNYNQWVAKDLSLVFKKKKKTKPRIINM